MAYTSIGDIGGKTEKSEDHFFPHIYCRKDGFILDLYVL